MKQMTSKTNETIDILVNSGWKIHDEFDNETIDIVAVAETEDQKTLVVLSSPVKDTERTKRFYFYQTINGKILSGGAYGDTITANNIAIAVEEFNETYREAPEFISKYVKPIKYLYSAKKRFFEFDEYGLDIESQRFNGTFEEGIELMGSLNWEIPVGTTSNCDEKYNIEAVARTVTNEVLAITKQENFMGIPCFVTPCRFYIDGVAEGNYGTPTSGDFFQHAIVNFNKNIYDSQKYGCKFQQIVEVVTKNGNKLEIPEFKELD